MPERRCTPAAGLIIERRDGEDGIERPRIVGHAAMFDQWTTLYEGRYWTWREVVRPGAFKRAIAEKQDVRGLFNHDSNIVLGRTAAGTLTLSEDVAGLRSEIDPPDTQTIRDLVLAPISRGDVSGMSFAFSLPASGDRKTTEKPDGSTVIETPHEKVTLRYEGERLIEEREILDADLYDVSPVTYPAYEGTDVALRSRPEVRDRIEQKDRPHRRPASQRESLRSWLKG